MTKNRSKRVERFIQKLEGASEKFLTLAPERKRIVIDELIEQVPRIKDAQVKEIFIEMIDLFKALAQTEVIQ